MKLAGILGVGSGKLGSSVFSVNAGQQIVRQYQPIVANPSTQSQVDQRAKLKLMSQIAAALAPVIAIPKDGLKTSRSQFISKNFRFVSADAGSAMVTIENLQLTNGNTGIPGIVARRAPESGVSISLADRADGAITRVVYIMYVKTSENTLQLVQSTIADAAGDAGTFPATLVYTQGELVLFAYGMKDLNAKARGAYENMSVASGEDIATLVMQRSINFSDYQFTQTRGATMFADENEITSVPDGYARVFVTATAGGTASGAGTFEIGSQVTVTAIMEEDYTFVGWRKNGTNTIVSTLRSYTFTLNGTTDLVAVFRSNSTPATYTITAYPNQAAYGTVEMVPADGIVTAGQSITLKAKPIAPNVFMGWSAGTGGTYISTQSTYTFVPNSDMSIMGHFGNDES